MGNSYFTNPLVFIITTLFDLYLLAVLLRFLLQWVRADFYNPVSQFLVKVTNPCLVPLRRVLPGLGGVDVASIVLMLLIAAIELTLLHLLLNGMPPSPLALLPYSLAKIIELTLNIFFFTILIQVVLSWVAPHNYNPVSALLYQLNEPLLRPIRRLLPAVPGFDFSPLVAMLLLHLSKMILLPPLYMLAQ